MMIGASIASHDAFLRAELGDEVVDEGLAEKRRKMATSPFAFLRASYFRWAETIAEVAPSVMDAPSVLAVGDIHLENFGTWRDADGRLVWGVNDVDEAADMPWTLDLVRLATSALLATREADASAIAARLVEGYRSGLAAPRAYVLDREHAWLREALIVPEAERAAFWTKLAKKRQRFERLAPAKRPPLWPRYRDAAMAALPPGAGPPALWYRSAGLGSLGRPRWVAEAEWRGDIVLREAKAVIPSAWTRLPGRGGRAIRCVEIATGRFRAPDPWYAVADGVAVRRLSPNSRKINAASPEGEEGGTGLALLLGRDMLLAMGAELAAIHLGRGDHGGAIGADLARRERRWLADAATRAAAAVERDFEDFAA